MQSGRLYKSECSSGHIWLNERPKTDYGMKEHHSGPGMIYLVLGEVRGLFRFFFLHDLIKCIIKCHSP